jgi:integrase/recombinase XerD
MLTIFRRHLKHRERRAQGRKYRRCRCPVWVDGSLNGLEIHKSIGTRDWNKAQEIVRGWEADGRCVSYLDKPKKLTIELAFGLFKADLVARNLQPSTVRKYDLLSRQITAFACCSGLRLLEQLNLAALRQFRAEWRDGPLSSAKKLERLRAFFRFAQESQWIAENPAQKIKTPHYSQRQTLPFTHEEMSRILAALNSYVEQIAACGRLNGIRLRGLVFLLRYSGMRIGDVVKLSEDQVSGNKLFIYTQKSGVPVYVVLPDFVVQIVENIPRIASKYFFWNGIDNLDTIVGSWQKRLRKLFKLAVISGGHAHRFRDTFATELLSAGIPIERVAVLLGHRSVKVTEKHYAAWTDSRQRQVEADLQRAWDRDPLVLLATKGTQKLHEKTAAVN